MAESHDRPNRPRVSGPKVLAALCAAVVIGHLPAIIQEASAQPLCAHRGAEHAAQHHETRESDSHWHERHGDLPTCNLDKPDDVDDVANEHDDPRWFPPKHRDDQRHDDDNGDGTPLYRDHEGYHCYHLHCG